MKTIMISLTVLFTLMFMSTCSVEVVKNIQMDRNCVGYLKRAADANTVELAKSQVNIAVKYMEDNDLTKGFTSIIYNTPDEDIGFWYGNIKAAADELNTLKSDATQLEKSNVLMKLRETLLDGNRITCPSGIHKYPNNKLFALLYIISSALLATLGIIGFIKTI